MKFYTSLLAVLILLFSCKKNDITGNQISGTFISEHLLRLTPPVMYTLNSRITDTSYIRGFLNRSGLSGTMSEFDLLNLTQPYPDTVTIKLNNGTGIITARFAELFSRVGTVPFNLLTTQANEMIIELQDSFTVYYQRGVYGSCGISNSVLKYTSDSSCVYPPPSTPGYPSQPVVCSFKKKLPLINADNNVIILPMVRYLTSKFTLNSPLYCNQGQVQAYNLFNSSAISKVQGADTLVVQEMELRLIK